MPRRKKDGFSPAFYKRHRHHLMRVLRHAAFSLVVLAVFAAGGTFGYLKSGRAPYLAAFLLAGFLYFLVMSILGIRDQHRVALLPYFSQRLGDADTFLKGRSLLWHSRQLDELAARLGLRPLSDFASGDDLIPGEEVCWFEPDEALETVIRLKSSLESAKCAPELTSDLQALEAALMSAKSKGVRFCLLLREGSYASGHEMDQRKGSFF